MASEAESRIKERDDARKAAIEKRKQEKSEELLEQETQDHFVSQFTQQKDYIEMLLMSVSKENAKETFGKISTNMNSLKRLLSESTTFLPPFTRKSAQEKLFKLQEDINKRQEQLLPKQKFAFKSKTKKSTTSTVAEPNHNPPLSDGSCTTSDRDYSSETTVASNTIEVKNKANEDLILEYETVNNCDISLINLTSTTVKVIGFPATLHITDCDKSKIFCGPVQRSVFIDNCNDSSFTLACQQLRIHTTKHSILYIHVTSRSIIEDSTGLQFAPYNWKYPLLEEHFTLSGLSSDVNNWDKIDDFNWLTTKEHSPNWSLLPVLERQSLDSS